MFGARNVRMILLALALLAVGYVALGIGPAENPISISLAPLILVGVYCAFLPVAILYRSKEDRDRDSGLTGGTQRQSENAPQAEKSKGV